MLEDSHFGRQSLWKTAMLEKKWDPVGWFVAVRKCGSGPCAEVVMLISLMKLFCRFGDFFFAGFVLRCQLGRQLESVCVFSLCICGFSDVICLVGAVLVFQGLGGASTR